MELQDILAKTSAKVIFTKRHGMGELRTFNCCFFRLCICVDVYVGVCRTPMHVVFIYVCIYISVPTIYAYKFTVQRAFLFFNIFIE